jgi:hypothetical protein
MCAFGSKAHGLTVSATGPGDNTGKTLSASATFTVSNLDLVVDLSNDATFDPNDDEDILTGIFFSIDGAPHLMPVSAMVGDDSLVIDHKLPVGFDGNIGTQWAYQSTLKNAPQDANEGISSTSLKWFKSKDEFPGPKLKGAAGFGGISYGLTTLFDTPVNNRGNIKNDALVQNDIVFTFADLPPNFSVSEISNITFQYGTSVKAPELFILNQTIPEPSPLALVTLAILSLPAIMRRSPVTATSKL